MGYDVKLNQSMKVYLNGKYFCEIDGFEYEGRAILEGKQQPVLRITKTNNLLLDERAKQEKDRANNNYDAFYQEMIKKTRDQKYHIPLKGE